MKKTAFLLTSLAFLLSLQACRQKETVVEPDPAVMVEMARLDSIEKNIPAPKDYTDTIFGVPLEMVYVEGGSFTMGGIPGRDGKKIYGDEKPAHVVEMPSYYISRYPVTQELWEAVIGTNPSEFQNPTYPVNSISWEETIDFCIKLSLATGQPYRLPSEAEWEYAARGGNKTRNTSFSGSDFFSLVACSYQFQPCAVGEHKPNELGIYDMSSGVWEWCKDWYGEFSADTLYNPQGPALGYYKILKGGSWCSDSTSCRISHRSGAVKDTKAQNVGFRVVMERPEKSKPMK